MLADIKTLGERLKYLRKKKGWTQGRVGMELYVDGSTVARWERNERIPNNKMLNDIAYLYGISVKELDPEAKELMVEDVGKGKYICKFEPGEKGWQVAKRAWKNSVAFRCLIVAALISEVLVIWTGFSSNFTVYCMSIVAVGAVLLIGNCLWPAKKRLDKFLVKGFGIYAIIALVMIGVGI